MTFEVVGKIVVQNISCIKCGITIYMYNKWDVFSCSCGAQYKMTQVDIKNEQVKIEYDFTGFHCVHSDYNSKCNEYCPTQNMYCKKHCSDEIIESAKKDIEYIGDRIEFAKNKLTALEESKRIWIIQEMSGLNDE